VTGARIPAIRAVSNERLAADTAWDIGTRIDNDLQIRLQRRTDGHSAWTGGARLVAKNMPSRAILA
jgi:hypothetical protein